MYFINLTDDFHKRYDMAKFIEFDGQAYDILMSYMIRKIKSFQVRGYYEVSGEESRPDLVSYYIYGRTMYWWVIMIYNDLLEADQVTLGLRIKYPAVKDIEELYFSLNNKSKTGI